MKPLDKHYLSLQFKVQVYSKFGTEFQSFFEKIMEKALKDFQTIKPYGNQGDGGNDGYRKKQGIYYQVYAPLEPKVKEKKAAEKFEKDFYKLQNQWGEISNIREYHFVFNDKYSGSTQLLEETITKLETDNPSIQFNLFLAKDLEEIFFTLSDVDVLGLGFSIDHRQAILNAHRYLENVELELDRENANFALKYLESIRNIILALGDESLLLEYEILESRCLQKIERINEAKKKYESISIRYPNDPRSFLYLAEIYLHNEEFDRNKELLERAESINATHWLLRLEQAVRETHLREIIDAEAIDEKNFPEDPKIKASFYRVYGVVLEDLGYQTRANSFIEKSIHLNPDRFNSYIAKLIVIENRLFLSQDVSQRLQISQELLDRIKDVENKFSGYGDIGARNKSNLNIRKLNALHVQENIYEFENVSKETFDLLLTCYFDRRIEREIRRVLQFISLPDNELRRLLEYLKQSKNKISDALSRLLIIQFVIRDALFNDGRSFFEDIDSQRYLEFIGDLEKRNSEKALTFVMEDIEFSVNIANTLKNFPELREKIIESLPDDENIQKEKLQLLLSFDEKDFDKAFGILKQLDLSNLNYVECRPMLYLAQQKKAWDFEIVILDKLLEKEKNEKDIFILKSQLFNAYLSLKKYPEVIDIGEKLLEEDAVRKSLTPHNREALLTNTVVACFERGKIDNEVFKKAKELFEKHPIENPSFEFRVGVEAAIHLNMDEVENALKAVIEGVKIKKVFSPQEYAKLYPLLSIEIGNRIDMSLVSLNRVRKDTFVKLDNKDQWYFVGDGNELDALPIIETNEKYLAFIEKDLGSRVVFENTYSSVKNEGEIKFIFSVEQYVLWQSVHNFQKLSREGDLEWVQMIDIPQKEDTVDPHNLLKLFEDMSVRTAPFFEMYCKNNVPLAVLAAGEGGLINAIGHIQQENRGYINFSVGTIDELEMQKNLARKIIDEKMPFYVDGTSAMFLSELGVLQKIYARLPRMKVPQSVINLLVDITERFRYTAGQTGHMGYAQGKIIFSSVDKDKRELIRSNFIESIKLFESAPKSIIVISSANKTDCFSERKILAELSDACILSRNENIPVLTEDYLYLKMNELETKKKAPEYFSSWALMRVLYEKDHITFEEYLEYFGYLSSYRFRFLSLNPEDIEKAVFGEGEIKSAKPENIRQLNFPLTLSEEYGVPFQTALRIVGIFLFRIMMDDIISLNIVEKVFIEITESFPTSMSKKEFEQMLLGICRNVFENYTDKNYCKFEDKLKYQKFDRLPKVI